MFTSVLMDLSKEVDGIKRIVDWQHRLRETVNTAVATSALLNLEPVSLALLQGSAPDRLQWQLFDHCAAITRIYALFEGAVSDLIEEYLLLLPKVQPRYHDLHEDVRVNYRVGIGTILGKWSAEATSRYSHLAESAIAAGLADGLRNQPYSLVADAILTDTDNYRADTLKRLFKRCGFDDAFASVAKDEGVLEFCSENLGTETAESYLNEFVRTRNEAAHERISATLSVRELSNYGDFAVLVVNVLASVLRSRIIREGLSTGHSIHIGKVIHRFTDNVVGIEAMVTAPIAVGDSLFAGSKYINPVTVVSLQTENAPQEVIALSPGLQCGVKLDRRIPENSGIYRWT